MPVVTIAARPLPDLHKKSTLVRRVTEAVCEAYGMPPESVTVFVEEHSKENIGVAGRLVSEREEAAQD
jgi:4-oxalocrotonate tautomerase